MIFTVSEMEMLCMFHAGTRKKTIEILVSAASEMSGQLSERREAVQSAIKKLERMRDGEHACIAFEPEASQ